MKGPLQMLLQKPHVVIQLLLARKHFSPEHPHVSVRYMQ